MTTTLRTTSRGDRNSYGFFQTQMAGEVFSRYFSFENTEDSPRVGPERIQNLPLMWGRYSAPWDPEIERYECHPDYALLLSEREEPAAYFDLAKFEEALREWVGQLKGPAQAQIQGFLRAKGLVKTCVTREISRKLEGPNIYVSHQLRASPLFAECLELTRIDADFWVLPADDFIFPALLSAAILLSENREPPLGIFLAGQRTRKLHKLPALKLSDLREKFPHTEDLCWLSLRHRGNETLSRRMDQTWYGRSHQLRRTYHQDLHLGIGNAVYRSLQRSEGPLDTVWESEEHREQASLCMDAFHNAMGQGRLDLACLRLVEASHKAKRWLGSHPQDSRRLMVDVARQLYIFCPKKAQTMLEALQAGVQIGNPFPKKPSAP